MSKGLSVLHNVIWCVLFLSLAVNAYFICTYIRNNRQTGSSSEGLKDELADTTSSITSAERTTEQVSNGLITVSNELSDSQTTTNKLVDTTKESVKGCGDIESTITDLRSQVKALENSCNNNYIDDSDISNNNGSK